MLVEPTFVKMFDIIHLNSLIYPVISNYGTLREEKDDSIDSSH